MTQVQKNTVKSKELKPAEQVNAIAKDHFMKTVKQLDENITIVNVIDSFSPLIIDKMNQSKTLNHACLITDGKSTIRLSLERLNV